MTIKAYVASAFCKEFQGGNKAGVVLFQAGLNIGHKQRIAALLGYSETAFVTKSSQGDFALEYFTPAEEVPLCGHATIATFALMKHLNMLNQSGVIIETKSGLLSVNIEEEKVFMEQTKPQYADILPKSAFDKCFDVDCVSEAYPIQIVSTGLRDIILPIKSEDALNTLKPQFEAISEVSRTYSAVGIHAFALQGERIVCRNFAPLYDIPEESATGTANCALASYLYKHGILRRDEYVIAQGLSLNSPSEITVRLQTENDEIARVFVGGYGRFFRQLLINL